MATVTQNIPTLTGGISQQPDELKLAGQVNVAKNVLPDVTHGLLKRPGSQLIRQIAAHTNSSKWFHYYRDETEQYIGQIDLTTGDIKIWRTSTGAECSISYSDATKLKNYLKTTGSSGITSDDVQTLTVNDYTFVTNRNKTVSMSTKIEPLRPPEVFVELKQIKYASQYALNLFDDTTTQEVTTATRIKVERILDSSNSCNTNGVKFIKATANNHNNRFKCGQPVGTEGGGGKHSYCNKVTMRDALCPNTATEIFAGIGSGTEYFDKSEPKSHDANTEQLDTINVFGIDVQKVIVGDKFYSHMTWTKAGNNNFARPDTSSTIKAYYAIEDQDASGTDNSAGIVSSHSATFTSVTANNNVTITFNNHPFLNGDTVRLTGTNFPNGFYTVSNKATNTFQISTSSNLGAYTDEPVTFHFLQFKNNEPPKDYVTSDNWGSANSSKWDGMASKANYQVGLRETHTIRVFPSSYTGEGLTIGEGFNLNNEINSAVTGRKNLSFRITTIGQSVADETSNTNITYSARYTTTHDLLHGGEGWQVGDHFYVWMANARYKITVEAISTSKVQANLARVRPLPTPFDTETVLTAESILGDLRTEIIASERFLDSDVSQIGNGLYISQPSNATLTSLELINAIANETVQSGDLLLKSNGHGFQTGHRVQYKLTGGSAISGLTPDNYYYVRRYNNNKFRLATSLANANSGTVVQSGALSAGITYTLPSGTHTFETGDFNASTPVNDLLNVVSGQVDTVADLPRQCKHGFVVKVSNSQDTEDDDHFLKFFGDNDRDGTGVFEECAKPGTLIEFDNETMPIQIVSPSPNNFNVDFVSWEEAAVGDTDPDTGTNPQPTFVGKSISKILFHRNRLCLLSNENVIMSRPGNFFNFWSKTATTFSAQDVIDVSCSSTTPAVHYDGIGVNAGLLLFTDNQQFLLTTDSDVLAPNTVKLNSISTYNFNKGTSPISLGTTVGFLDNANKYSRFFEMSNILREGEPIIIEQSKIVSNLFSKDLKLISNSRENSVIFFSQENTNQIYGLRYHQSGQERVLQSWFEWQINGNIQYHCMINDTLFVVVKNGNYYQLIKYSIKLDEDGKFINQDDNDYRIHLDLYQRVEAFNISYDSTTNKTTFSVPVGSYSGTGTLALYDDGEGTSSGLYATGIVATISNETTSVYEVTGNFASNNACVVGYLYDMEVELPKIYVTQTTGERRTADTRGSLVLHRAKVNFGPVGLVSTTLKRVGKTDYTKLIEQPIADSYKASDAAIEPLVRQTIPIYEKNTNVVLTIKSTHPGPATLYSYNWEGDYTNKLYTRV